MIILNYHKIVLIILLLVAFSSLNKMNILSKTDTRFLLIYQCFCSIMSLVFEKLSFSKVWQLCWNRQGSINCTTQLEVMTLSFFEIFMFLVSIPGYIADCVQLLGWISAYFKSKKKANPIIPPHFPIVLKAAGIKTNIK